MEKQSNSFNTNHTSHGNNDSSVEQLSFQLNSSEFIETSADERSFQIALSEFNNHQNFNNNAALQNEYWLSQYGTAGDTKNQEPKFFFYSSLLHAALALASLFVKLPEYIKPEVETITVELEEQTPEEHKRLLQINRGEEVMPTKGRGELKPAAAAATVKELQNPKSGILNEEQIVVAPKTSPKAKSAVAKAATRTGGGKAKVARSAPSRAGVPESLEDIAAPKLDFDGVDVSQSGVLGDDEFEDDFRNIDKSHAAALTGAKNQFDNDLKRIADESDMALQAAEAQEQENARALKTAQENLRLKNAQVVERAQQAERAALERAAKAQALAEEQERARAAAAAAAVANAKGPGYGEAQQGRGAGNVGDEAASSRIAGQPNGVRSLDQLRQMPGNPKPQYSMEERLQRHQGNIVFYAYITKAGKPENFKMVTSTGYRNLDSKTLTALKKWRFYPGQEGWVELPFEWNLKGGVQEMPTALRRRAGGF